MLGEFNNSETGIKDKTFRLYTVNREVNHKDGDGYENVTKFEVEQWSTV